MARSAAAETPNVRAASRNATDVLTDASSTPAKAQPRISVRFSLVAKRELARSNLPGATISGSMASLAGSKKTPPVAIAKLSANTAPVSRVDPVARSTSTGNASAASRSPIWETNCPAQSRRKPALRNSGAS